MSKQWIEVNGTKIDKQYLEDNIFEARAMDWSKSSGMDMDEHAYCLICGQPLRPGADQNIYKSMDMFLDGYCFENFILQ